METLGRDEIVHGRPAYMPAFTPIFDELSLNAPVRDGETLLGFTIRDVLPERRWALKPSGEVLDRRNFEAHYEVWNANVVVGNPPYIVSIPSVNKYYAQNLAPVPTAAYFVSHTINVKGQEVPIGFDPNKKPEKNATFELRDGRGNVISPFDNQSDQKLAKMTMLAEMRERGTIDDAQLANEMAAMLVTPVRVEVKNDPEEEPGKVGRPAGFVPAPITALCGRSCKGKAGKLAHERSCKECRARAAEAALEESHAPDAA